MRGKTDNIRDAKAQFSNLISRVVCGERIVIARKGKPIAELRPVRKIKNRSTLVDDPLLQVHEYSYDGPIGPITDRDIDSTVCDF